MSRGNDGVLGAPDQERRHGQARRPLPGQVPEIQLRQDGDEGSEVGWIPSRFVGGCGSALRKLVRVAWIPAKRERRLW